MAENTRPPVAIRIVRPYDTEEDLLDNELETIGKTSVVLIGAHPRPTGVILRFEVTLASGTTVLRGEGRVLAHKDNAFRGQSGLTLRFTRLDPKSKAIVDRATAMREARAPSSGEVGSPSRPAPRPDSPIAEALSAATPSPGPAVPSVDQEAAVASARAAARDKANAAARTNAKRTARGQGLTPPPPPSTKAPQAHGPQEIREPEPSEQPEPEQPEPEQPEPSEVAAAAPEPTPVTSIPGAVAEKAAVPAAARPRPNEAPPNRDELLSRLRERAGTLPRERVEEILAARTPR